jgi:hypothetical protein
MVMGTLARNCVDYEYVASYLLESQDPIFRLYADIRGRKSAGLHSSGLNATCLL